MARAGRPGHSSRAAALVAFLATADLRHEWVLSATLTLAIAAVLAPLLLLLGLKYGTVEYHLKQLIQDPVYREIRPERAGEFPHEQIAAWAGREDVAFIVPNILPGVSTVTVVAASGEDARVDVLPTAPGDPLLLDNGVRVPEDGELILSLTAAEKLEVEPGDRLQLIITRQQDGRLERVPVDLTVAGVLPARADPLARLYVVFELLEDIETYRAGEAVPERGWPGGHVLPAVSYDGVLLCLPEPLPPTVAARVLSGTGFARRVELPLADAEELLGLDLANPNEHLLLSAVGNTVGSANVGSLRDRLRGQNVIVMPFVSGLVARVRGAPAVPVTGISLAAGEAERAGLAPPPWAPPARDIAFGDLAQAIVPATWDIGVGETVEVTFPLANADTTLPLKVAAVHDRERLLVPAELAGMLRTGQDQRITYDAAQGLLKRTKGGYRGFRLYARSIDDVAGLRHHFVNTQNFDVITRAAEIDRVKRMGRALTRLFWLVAVVGLVGGVAAMTASLWAAVERKRKDIGLMRLFGVSARAIAGFPITQAMVISALAAITACAAFFALSLTINTVFASDLPLGKKLCVLPPTHLGYAFVFTVLTAIASSGLAASRAVRIDPAEAIRDD